MWDNSPFYNKPDPVDFVGNKTATVIPKVRMKRLVEDAQAALDHEDIDQARQYLEELTRTFDSL